jgi:hypothetical protein
MTGSPPDSDTPMSAEYTEPPGLSPNGLGREYSMSWGQYNTREKHSGVLQ